MPVLQRAGPLMSSVAGSFARPLYSQRPEEIKQQSFYFAGGKLRRPLQDLHFPLTQSLPPTTLQRRTCAATSTVQPVIASKHPFQVELKAGKRYAWCACGHSKKQPFCDGSHMKAAPKISSLKFKPEETKEAWLCGCKYTKNPPYCDGTHKEDFVQKADLHSHPQL